MVLTNIHLNKNCRKCILRDSFNCRESDVGESGNMYHLMMTSALRAAAIKNGRDVILTVWHKFRRGSKGV